MKRVYIAGPITGVPDHVENFRRAFEFLRQECGVFPVNPIDVLPECGGECSRKGYNGQVHAWGCYMRFDLLAMLTCDEVYALKGWRHSRGARLEVLIAGSIGMPIKFEEEVNVQRNPEVGRPGHVRSGEAPGG